MDNKKTTFTKDIYNFIPIGDYKELYVIEAAYRKKHADISKRPMKKPYYAFHLFLKGSGTLETDNGVYELKKNSIFIRFPSEEITYYDEECDPWEYIFVTFQGTKIAEYMKRLSFTPINRVFQSDKLLTTFFKEMVLRCKETPPSSDLIANSSLYSIFAHLAISRCAASYEKYDIQQMYIAQALEYIDTTYHDCELSAEHLAKHLSLNIDYFLRIFKLKTGTPFSKFLISKRMSYAISMIDKGETSVSKLAYAVGYQSPAYFTLTFKKSFGVLPSEYIQSNKPKEVM